MLKAQGRSLKILLPKGREGPGTGTWNIKSYVRGWIERLDDIGKQLMYGKTGIIIVFILTTSLLEQI